MDRSAELKSIELVFKRKKSDFFYVRGRRRVGKSWLLVEASKRNKNIFYFMGAKDARDEKTRQLFAEAWDKFTGVQTLTRIKKAHLTWPQIFEQMTEYFRTVKGPHGVILDEIQWIAKTGAGFCGLLKEWWLRWEAIGTVKVIVCGSSNKFFRDQSGGEEQILRGIKTHSDIWVNPFSLGQVKRELFSIWREEEVALLYMLVGGIPYYLQQIDAQLGFIQAINKALFIRSTVFLEEIDEVLRVEFNKSSVITAKEILHTFGAFGKKQVRIRELSGLSKSTVSETLEKLREYGIIYSKTPLHQRHPDERGMVYFAKDFYINTYFEILEPLKERIQANEKSLLFPHEVLQGKSGYYIQNFTGPAYERLLRSALESGIEQYPILFEKLQLPDNEFSIGEYWDEDTQVDLIVEHRKDRISRVIEVKWKDEKNIQIESLCREVIIKKYIPPPGFVRKNYLVLSYEPTAAAKSVCKKMGVDIITISDFFS